MLLPAASAARRGSEAVAPASVSRSFYFTSNGPPLLNSVKKTLKGTKAKDGSCIWHPADMTLAPQDRAIEQRQVSADYANCTTVVEIGNPTQIDRIEPDEQLTTTANAARPRLTRTTASKRTLAGRKYTVTSSKAYYKVTWWDVANQPLNYVRSILNWFWRSDGGCINGSIAEWAEFHQVASGWTITSWDKWKTTSCTDHRTHSSADFKNSIFCTPPSTYMHYRNVRIRGGYTGTYGAALDSTWTDGTQCAPLHWSGQVVKEF
jgi:hypothetical protein